MELRWGITLVSGRIHQVPPQKGLKMKQYRALSAIEQIEIQQQLEETTIALKNAKSLLDAMTFNKEEPHEGSIGHQINQAILNSEKILS